MDYRVGVAVKLELTVGVAEADAAPDVAIDKVEKILKDHGIEVRRIWWEHYVGLNEY